MTQRGKCVAASGGLLQPNLCVSHYLLFYGFAGLTIQIALEMIQVRKSLT